MQKLSLLPLLLITSIGALWASTLIFPNTSEFPRSPGGAGTISGALALFGLDGSATNALQLDGKYASGYLQDRDCSGEPINKVWIGIDIDGRAICGKKTPQLASIGRFTEIVGTVQVMKNGTNTWSSANTTDDLKPGDIVRTDPSATGTITFTDDLSILRLDVATVVELQTGENTSGQSVAQAILSDGRLWGRILSSTGVNLGGGGLVAGVRGTSVSIEESGGQYTLAIVDSRTPSSAAILHTLSPSTATPPNGTSSTSYIAAERQIIYRGSDTVVPTSALVTKTSLLTNSAWIRKNMRADIDYLVTQSTTNNTAIDTAIISTEYAATLPSITNIEQLTALCEDDQIYWRALIGTTYDKCQSSNLTAFADYTQTQSISTTSASTATPLYLSGISLGAGGNIKMINGSYEITVAGQYISYPIGPLNLAGKTITIELGSAIPNIDSIKYYVLDLGNETGTSKIIRYYIYNGSVQCTYRTNNVCQTGDFEKVSDTKYHIKIPATPTQMIIGNQGDNGAGSYYTKPIGTTSKNIRIQ